MRILPTAVLVTSLITPAFAGGSPENALLIVDPSNPDSMYVANYYKSARNIPDRNVLYMAPTPSSWSQFAGAELDAFLGALESQHLADHIDYVILPPGGSFQLASSGTISDGCSSVNRFSATAPYTLALEKTLIQGGLTSSHGNQYYRGTDEARAFDSQITWSSGIPFPTGQRYYLGAMLGYSGPNGNTIPEILSMIDRSVLADQTHPVGTIYYMHTNDPARSAPRDPFFPAAVTSITNFGGLAQLLFADLPLTHQDCLGIMTGVATPDILNANLTILPGAFCDHLTSYAATFDDTSQVKMARWITKGASGTSGTVEEPCNYPGKFPHARLHVWYEQGLSLGEAWFRSLSFDPFQELFTGDPLTRPFSFLPVVSVSGVPVTPASNMIALTPSATTAHPTASISSFELFVDGRSLGSTPPTHHFALDTTAFSDGWHELRVLAYDNALQKNTGRWIGSITTDNHARSATLGVSPLAGNLTTRFDLTLAAAGGTLKELRVLQGSRVIAAASTAGTLSVFGRTLGAGTTQVELEAEFTDGLIAHSPPIQLAIQPNAGVASAAPVAYSYTKHVLATQVSVVELPTVLDDDLALSTWSLLLSPTQASVIGSGVGPYRLLRPNAGASGTDSFTYRLTTPFGTSNVATVTLVYDTPYVCPPIANYCTAAPNSAGFGAFMSVSGSTSVGANNLSLSVSGCPPNKAGIFICGPNATSVPFGNGTRCVDNPFARLGVVFSDGFGDVAQSLDLTAPPFNAGTSAALIGARQNFQLWYRDPGVGAGFNFSDAVGITFCY